MPTYQVYQMRKILSLIMTDSFITVIMWGDISTLSGTPLKLVDKFTYLGCNISSTESNVNIGIRKAWITIDKLSIIRKSDLSNKIGFLPGCGHVDATGTLIKCLEKKLDKNYTRMLHAGLNKFLKQLPTKQQLYSHLPPIS